MNDQAKPAHTPGPWRRVVSAATVDGLLESLDLNLTARERDVIRLRLGIGCSPQTLAAIGQRYSVSRQAIHQAEKAGRKKLGMSHFRTGVCDDSTTSCGN